MIPMRVYLEGFLSYREPQTLSFEDASLWVLSGPNGAGKSAVFDAITFALFGKHRGKGNTNKGLINHDSDKLIVEFDFELDGHRYRVRRTCSKRGRPTFQACHLLPLPNEEMQINPIEGTDLERGLEDWIAKKIGLSYDAFISSVLLKQGETEALLSKDPKDRYKVLAQVIDLSAYQRLHECAKSQHKNWEAGAKTLEQRLANTPEVSGDNLNAAKEAATQAECEWKAIQSKADGLRELRGQAARWEELSAEVKQLKKQEQDVRDLLKRESEINASFARWQELDRVLPVLVSIIEQRQRLDDCQQRITQTEQRVETLRADVEQATAICQKSEASAERLENEANDLQVELDMVRARLDELSPWLTKLEAWGREQTELERVNGEIAKLPDQLPQLLREAKEKAQRLAEVEQALKWLEQLAESRSILAEITERGQAKRAELDRLKAELEKLNEEKARVKAEVESATSDERACVKTEASAEQTHKSAVEKKKRFTNVAAQARCDLCGQQIDDKHRQNELARLEAEIVDAERAWCGAKERQQEAAKKLGQFSAEQSLLNQKSSQIEKDRTRIESELGSLRSQCKGDLDSIRRAFDNLPPDYQKLVSPDQNNQIDWLETSYPTANDLARLRQEATEKKSCNDQLTTVQNQHQSWQSLDAQRQAAQKRQDEIGLAERLAEAQQARAESQKLQPQKVRIEQALDLRKKEKNSARIAAHQARQSAQDLQTKLSNCHAEVEAARARQTEITHQMQNASASLPESWQPQAATIGQPELEKHIAEQRQLGQYKQLADELAKARQSLIQIEQQREERQAQIEVLPPLARRTVQTVAQELQTALQERDAADALRQLAKGRLDDLERQQQKRQQSEAEYKVADRQQKLYKQLMELLGAEPGGLQLNLLQNAERSIVGLANEALAGLSRSQMRLELREDGTGAKSGKALDLVAYNYEIDQMPMPIENASGGQKIRLAVSLALAIGRYAREQTRSLESVIIDEGFSNLDRNGRDDMAQELRQLQQQLSRILIVSHEEDIARAFDNVYAIELVDRASRVELAQRS